jgi:hypothetical protein
MRSKHIDFSENHLGYWICECISFQSEISIYVVVLQARLVFSINPTLTLSDHNSTVEPIHVYVHERNAHLDILLRRMRISPINLEQHIYLQLNLSSRLTLVRQDICDDGQ